MLLFFYLYIFNSVSSKKLMYKYYDDLSLFLNNCRSDNCFQHLIFELSDRLVWNGAERSEFQRPLWTVRSPDGCLLPHLSTGGGITFTLCYIKYSNYISGMRGITTFVTCLKMFSKALVYFSRSFLFNGNISKNI